MKHIHHLTYIAGVAVALLTVSCRQAETEPEQLTVEASFDARINGETHETKGVPVEDLNSFKRRVELFTIWGFMGNSRIADLFNKEVRIYGSRYYPIKNGEFEFLTLPDGLTRTNEMFYGLAADMSENTLTVTNVEKNGGVTFNYTAHPAHTDPAHEFYHRDAEALGEVLAGILVSGGVNEDGIIPLDFYHPLAAVRFRAGSDISKTITITEIGINGVKTQGTCNFCRNSEKNIVMGWSNLSTPQNYLQTYNNTLSPSTSLHEEINDSQSRKAWFIIPQTFGAGSSIVIKYDMRGDQHTATIPLDGVTFDVNHVYWYTLTKGGVVFESRVNSWSEGVSQTSQYVEPGIYW